jgi:hypothetical protein
MGAAKAVALVTCVFLEWSDLSYKATERGEEAGGRGNERDQTSLTFKVN